MKSDTTSQLPAAAEATMIALATPAQNGLTGIPVLLWGRPGVGKSSFIESVSRPDFPVTTLIASIHDPTDFSGLPILEEGTVRYASPEWVGTFTRSGEGILFLDELSTVPPSVQSALLRVVFERRVGFTDLPQGVRIVAAANPPDLMVGGWELSPPLRNRFLHLQWSTKTDDYIDALLAGWPTARLPRIDREEHTRVGTTYKARVAAFLRLQPEMLETNPEDNPYGFASPRTWDFVIALLASAELLGYSPEDSRGGRIMFALASGCLGEGAAIAFLEYLRNLRLPDPRKVLEGTAEVDVADLDDGELYVLFASLSPPLLAAVGTRDLLPYSSRYLDLILAAFSSGRRDIAFAPLRDLARSHWLTEVYAVAREQGGDYGPDGAGAGVVGKINHLFADEGLSQFIDVLA